MRPFLPFLFAILAFSLSGCSRHPMPPIKDAEALRKDCLALYQEYLNYQVPTNAPNFDYQNGLGFKEIPREKWGSSILELNPYMVCIYQDGVQIWIELSKRGNLGYGQAYHVSSNPDLPPPSFTTSNHFVFKPASYNGIYIVEQQLPWNK
jgi:hypothetical protein